MSKDRDAKHSSHKKNEKFAQPEQNNTMSNDKAKKSLTPSNTH